MSGPSVSEPRNGQDLRRIRVSVSDGRLAALPRLAAMADVDDSGGSRGGTRSDHMLIVCLGRTDVRQSGVEKLNAELRSEFASSELAHEWLDWANYTPTHRRGMFSIDGVRGALSTLTRLGSICWRNRRSGTVVYYALSQQGWGLARDVVTALVAIACGGRHRFTVIHLHGEFRPELQPRPLLARLSYACVARMPQTSFVANVRDLSFGGAPSIFVPNRPTLSPSVARARHEPKSADPTLVFLGIFAPSKGAHVLIEAFEGLAIPAKLLVIGPVFKVLSRYERRFCTPERWDHILSVLQTDDRIESVGPVYDDERFSYLRRAWTCLLPSFTEGGCLVLQESLAVGTQVIATRVGPLPEMVEGTAGHLLVDAGDVAGLRKAMEETLQRQPEEPVGVGQTYFDGGTTVSAVLSDMARVKSASSAE
jgi:glycosyltransferase involved in cell wall biosynthesis